MPSRCYCCQKVIAEGHEAYHCWCYHKSDPEANYRGICDTCIDEQGKNINKFLPGPDHRLTKVHKYDPEEMAEYKRKSANEPRSFSMSRGSDGKVVYESLDGVVFEKTPVPKCTCCDHSAESD